MKIITNNIKIILAALICGNFFYAPPKDQECNISSEQGERNELQHEALKMLNIQRLELPIQVNVHETNLKKMQENLAALEQEYGIQEHGIQDFEGPAKEMTRLQIKIAQESERIANLKERIEEFPQLIKDLVAEITKPKPFPAITVEDRFFAEFNLYDRTIAFTFPDKADKFVIDFGSSSSFKKTWPRGYINITIDKDKLSSPFMLPEGCTLTEFIGKVFRDGQINKLYDAQKVEWNQAQHLLILTPKT